MKNFRTNWLLTAGLVGAIGSMNCGGGDESTGAGGSSAGGKGGSGKGGSTATAGKGGGSAGAIATAGSGGATAGSGGKAGGSGGSSGGTAGTNPDGGTPTGLPCTALSTFDTATIGVDGFSFNQYEPSGQKNLGKLVDGGAAATLAFSATEGEPTAGSLKADLPFNDYTQFVQIQKDFATTALKDWTGLRLHVRVKIASGLTQTGSNQAGIQPFVNSYAAGADGGAGTYNFSAKYSAAVAGNGWNDYVFDLVAGGAFDPTKIVSFGVQILTGDGVMGDAGVNPVKPTAAVVYIDSLWLSKADGTCPGGAGGTGGTAGAGGTAAGGTGGTATAGSGGKGGSTTGGTGGTATAGSGGTATAGSGGTATAGSGGTATAGSGGSATAGSGGSATAGSGGTATAGSGGTATAGSGGHAGSTL